MSISHCPLPMTTIAASSTLVLQGIGPQSVWCFEIVQFYTNVSLIVTSPFVNIQDPGHPRSGQDTYL